MPRRPGAPDANSTGGLNPPRRDRPTRPEYSSEKKLRFFAARSLRGNPLNDPLALEGVELRAALFLILVQLVAQRADTDLHHFGSLRSISLTTPQAA